MKSHMFRAGRAIAAVLVAASLATPITVWADDGGGRDNRARAQSQPQSQAQSKQAQQAKDRERAEQAKREQAKREQEKQAREQAAKQANEKAARERAEQAKRAQDAQRAKQEQERKEDERRNNRVLGALDETRDTKPSDHPSGKDRNDERGASSPQGASRSNPDGGGIDKPFAVGSLVAGSQGRGDFDGNNGCGNDNDFADDNNGNCGGRRNAGAQAQVDEKAEVAGVQVQQVQSDQKEAHRTDEAKSDHDKADKDKKDERRESVKSDDRHRSKDHGWGVLGRLLEWCRDVLSGSKPEVAGAQVKAPTATPSPTSTGPTAVPTSTPLPQVSGVKALIDHECVASEWHWVMTQLNDVNDAPLAITVTWANGQTLLVNRTAFTGKVAHYATTANLGSAVVNATTVAPAGWTGQFNLSHGPCISSQGVLGTQETAEPSHTAVPTSTPQPTHTPQPTATSTALPTNTATVQPTATLGSGVQAQALVSHECITYEWHWVITQLDSEAQAPAFVRVTWANGQTLDVARTGFTGKTAHYTIGSNLTSRVTSAVAGTALPSGWTGQFNLSHGPCL